MDNIDNIQGYWFITYKTYYGGVNNFTIADAVHTGTVAQWYLEKRKELTNFTIVNQFQITEESAKEILKEWDK